MNVDDVMGIHKHNGSNDINYMYGGHVSGQRSLIMKNKDIEENSFD